MMNLAEHVAKAVAALDSHPDSRLAIGLDVLRRASDSTMAGYDLLMSYVRATDPATLTGLHAVDVTRLRGVRDIYSGKILLGGLTYWNWSRNLHDLAVDIRDLVTDEEVRAMIGRLVEKEPVIGRLLADRAEQEAQRRRSQFRKTGVVLEDYLPRIESILDSEPHARLAISLELLRFSDDDAGAGEVCKYARTVDLRSLTGQLADDVIAVRRAIDVLAGRTSLDGTTYWGLQCSIGSLGGSIYSFATDAHARELVTRIAATLPANETGATA